MTKRPQVRRFSDLIGFISQRHSGNIKYDLDRIHLVLERMGNPERQLRGFHIAGTNGKGSTSAMTEAISLAHKHTTVMNTSPHLVDYRERFRINGKNITAKDLIRVYNRWSDLFEETESSFFEITTALAFYHFCQLQPHTSIFEVGLGGRLDATNPFNATVSIITTIAIDHPKTLGNTIRKIAFEKAGIIKDSIPLVIGDLHAEAKEVIGDVASAKSAPMFRLGQDFRIENIHISERGTEFDFINDKGVLPLPDRIDNLATNLIGEHQANNAALSIAAFSLYSEIIGENRKIELIRKSLQKVNWQGRMQIIRRQPLTILDCAHNEEGIEKLVNNLKRLYPGKSFRIVIAILRDKNIDFMISRLCSIASKLYITKNDSDRAADIEEQASIAAKCGITYSTEENIIAALDKATTEAASDEIIIVTGSIYTVSEIVGQIQKQML